MNGWRAISIHALLAESDYHSRGLNRAEVIFLSTLSLRRATSVVALKCSGNKISIHALLAESDWRIVKGFCSSGIFLSTLSLRRATSSFFDIDYYKTRFLSTLSLRRATPGKVNSVLPGLEFLSTLSLRRATTWPLDIGPLMFISIHALLAESDVVGAPEGADTEHISIHALLAESDSLWSAY